MTSDVVIILGGGHSGYITHELLPGHCGLTQERPEVVDLADIIVVSSGLVPLVVGEITSVLQFFSQSILSHLLRDPRVRGHGWLRPVSPSVRLWDQDHQSRQN